MPHAPSEPPSPEPVRRLVGGRWRIELLPRGPYRASYVTARPVIGFAFDAQRGVHAFGGDRRTGFRARPNGLARVPAGCDVYSRSDAGGEYLRVVDTSGGGCGHAERFGDAIDPVAIEMAHALRRELLSADGPDALACDALALGLERCAARVAGRPHERASGWLTPRRLDLVEALIDSRLDDATLRVDDLAAALGLSSGFLTRAFRAGTGRTPHAWIVERRLARARTLLLAGSTDLAGVARACGFASHSHLTARFRARYGTVPSVFRDRCGRA